VILMEVIVIFYQVPQQLLQQQAQPPQQHLQQQPQLLQHHLFVKRIETTTLHKIGQEIIKLVTEHGIIMLQSGLGTQFAQSKEHHLPEVHLEI